MDARAMQGSLCDKFRIQAGTLAQRRRFVRIDDATCARMEGLIAWADSVADELARELYDHQFEFEPTRRFFTALAEARGMALADLRAHLEQTQAGYFRGLFTGARDGYDLSYFEARLKVGRVHDLIDLPLKWYIGSYAEYARLVRRRLFADFQVEEALAADEAIGRVFNFDMQAVADAYLLSVFETMGLELSRLACVEGSDLADHMKDAKAAFKDGVAQLAKVAALLGDDAQELESLAARMSDSAGHASTDAQEASAHLQEVNAEIQTIAGAISQMEAAIMGVADNAAQAAAIAETAMGLGEGTQAALHKLDDSGSSIARAIRLITSIADQTNLLALNATITAARAGEKGRAFGVVATEVKELSKQTAVAADEVRAMVGAIQADVATADDSIRQISDVIQEMGDFQLMVAAAVQEQTMATREISGSVGSAAGPAEQIAQRVEGVAEASASTHDASAAVRASAEGLTRVAAQLQETLKNFRSAAPTAAEKGKTHEDRALERLVRDGGQEGRRTAPAAV
jgi:methyl-accepting chemotaxis protein